MSHKETTLVEQKDHYCHGREYLVDQTLEHLNEIVGGHSSINRRRLFLMAFRYQGSFEEWEDAWNEYQERGLGSESRLLRAVDNFCLDVVYRNRVSENRLRNLDRLTQQI